MPPSVRPAIAPHELHRSADFHHHRDYVIRELLAFHPAMEGHIRSKYKSSLTGTKRTASVHFHLGDDATSAGAPAEEQLRPSIEFYKQAMLHVLQNPSRIVYLLFTDQPARLTTLLASLLTPLDIEYIIVNEDEPHALLLMSLCYHHIGSTSALSFWGAYLGMHAIVQSCVVMRGRQEAARQRRARRVSAGVRAPAPRQAAVPALDIHAHAHGL